MRWYVSYPILAAGLAFGFDTFFPDEPGLSRPADADIRLQAEEPQTAPVVVMASDIEAAPASRVSAFSPGTRLLAAERPGTSPSVLDYLARTLTPRESVPAAAAPVAPVTVAAWKSAIVREWEPTAQTAPEAPHPEVTSRIALSRDIQRELQRVGCYLGAIDGVWGGGSQRAMLAFMDRVNASLPTREPDVFMLSLLRSQTSAVCGTSCPRGQSPTASGRCVPSTLVAQAERQTGPAAVQRDAWEPMVAEAAAERGPAPYGRMSIGGPKPDDVEQLSVGWTSVTGASRKADPLDRTAALDPPPADAAVVPGEEGATGAAISSFDLDAEAVDAPRVKRSGNRSKARARPSPRTSSYRHVQNLFQHPLGRM